MCRGDDPSCTPTRSITGSSSRTWRASGRAFLASAFAAEGGIAAMAAGGVVTAEEGVGRDAAPPPAANADTGPLGLAESQPQAAARGRLG